MNCNIAEDLLPLYVEGICGEKTKKELEDHIDSCEVCREKWEKCKEELEQEIETSSKHMTSDESIKKQEPNKEKKTIDSMKKVKKKLTFRKIMVAVLCVILIAVIGGVGFLYVGEISGEFMNFTTIHNIVKLRKISKALCQGDVEPLISNTHFDYQDYWVMDGEMGLEQAQDRQRKKVKDALDYYFQGKPFQYRIAQLEFVYSNDLNTGVSSTWDGADSPVNPSAIICVEYYNAENSIWMMFVEKGDRKFEYFDDKNSLADHVPTIDSYSDGDVLLHIVRRAVRNYEKNDTIPDAKESRRPGGILGLVIRYNSTDASELGEGCINNRIEALWEKGWSISDFSYQIATYDEAQKCFSYNCQFAITNDGGEKLLFQQRFDYGENDLYIMDGKPAELIFKTEGVPEDIEKEILSLFKPMR